MFTKFSPAEKPDRKIQVAIMIALFGLLLFLALALTVPWNKTS